jgi:nucleotide-binding universal stress UspA family protein
MLDIKKILHPTDFSNCADQAMTQAVHLARQYKAELHMLHASMMFTADYFGYLEEVYEKLRGLAISHMNTAIEKHNTGDLKIELVEKLAVSVGSLVLEYVKDQEIDLIVMGTHGRRGLEHLFLGSIAEEMVQSAPCSILTVREIQEPKPTGRVSRILVPIDFSEHSRKALTYAKEIASVNGARLQLLHVIEEPIYPAFYSAYSVFNPTLFKDIYSEAEKELKKLFRETEGPEVKADIHLIHGRAAMEIPKFAEKNGSDLIVIATHGLTGIKHLLLGSVAEKVVRLAKCPVFSLKVFGRSLLI